MENTNNPAANEKIKAITEKLREAVRKYKEKQAETETQAGR